MDRFPDYCQVVSLPAPPIEAMGDAKPSPELAELANDGMAELVVKHPDRFPGFVAALPMNNPDAAVKEIDRAVLKLGAVGFQIYTNVNGRPLDEPDFLPIFEKMAERNVPIWLHPSRRPTFPITRRRRNPNSRLWWVFGWPYETSVAMARILFAGYFDRFPELKIITHHMGAMVPYFSGTHGPGTRSARRAHRRGRSHGVWPAPEEAPAGIFQDVLRRHRDVWLGRRLALRPGLFWRRPGSLCVGFALRPGKRTGYIRETIRCVDAWRFPKQTARKSTRATPARCSGSSWLSTGFSLRGSIRTCQDFWNPTD